MRDCLILGTGRSGTSMLTGILAQNGYFLGDSVYTARIPSNPKGFFESREINQINEAILSNYDHKQKAKRIACMFLFLRRVKVSQNQRWLAALPLSVDIENNSPDIASRIESAAAKSPFCYKDPRFSYTLPVWKKSLKPDTRFVCIYRQPDITVNSILKECRTRPYLADLNMTVSAAYDVWVNMYAHILLKNHDIMKRFRFVHYDQILDGTALGSLSEFIQAPLAHDFVDQGLKRTPPGGRIPKKAAEIYNVLCDLSGYPFPI